MTRRKLFAFALGWVTLGLIIPMSLAPAQAPAEKPLEIGMAKTFFNDVPEAFISIATAPFDTMMKKTTALQGKLSTSDPAAEVARKLNESQLQIGVFNSYEFAWAKQKYPDLQPLLIAVNKHRDVRAFVVVHKDSPAKSIADLAGKTLALARGTKEHCKVYLDRKCSDNNQAGAKSFFGKIVRSDSYEDALDDICRKKVDAAVVDTISIEFYKDIKLPCFEVNLRILVQSDPFPPAVLAYKKGGLSEATAAKFRDGLVKAHEDPEGREMMTMWHIRAFEAVPKDYIQGLADILKQYPAPESTKISMR